MDLSKLKLPAAIVLTLLGSAAGAGGTYAAAKAKLEETAKTAEEAKVAAQKANDEARKAQDDVHAHAVDIAVIKTKVDAMQATLERIEQAVKR